MNASAPNACLTEAELEELGRRGDLSPGREAELQRHLESCVACRTRWEERRGDEEMFRELRAARQEPALAPGDSPGVNLTRTHAPSDGNVPSPMLPPELAVTIEGYSITREIGRGGMGVVFEAIQQRLNRKVALKILPGGSGPRDRDAVNRFRREATAAARLHHTHIVPVYDFGQSGVAHYYAMELVEGRSMTDMIRRLADANAPNASPAELERLLCDATELEPGAPGSSGTFNKSDSFAAPGSSGGSFSLTRTRVYYRHVARWMADAADALHYAHDQGIIHRDIKPSNLLLARDGRIMILDFGLAKSQGDHSVTMTGTIVGTLRYMSPEQAMAKRMKVDHRTDIYSLGTTLYELLAFQPAFAGHDDKETLGLIITRDPTAPRKIISTVPRELETICLKTLEKDPGARYQTARELAEDLRRFIEDRPIVARPLGPVGRAVKFMRRRRAATVAAVASLLLLLATLLAVWNAGKKKEAQLAKEAQQIEFTQKEVASLLEAVRNYMKDGNLDQAEERAHRVIKLDPSNYGALMNLAIINRYRYEGPPQGNVRYWDEAMRFVDRAITENEERPDAWNTKGVLLRLVGRFEDAEVAHDRCVNLNKTYYPNWVSFANLYICQDKYDKAESCLLEGTKWATEESGGMPWLNLAAVQLHMRKTESYESCEEGMQRGKDRPSISSRLLRAKVFLTHPQHRDAKKALRSALSASDLEGGEKHPRVKRLQALAEVQLGDYEEAMASAKEALALRDTPAWSYLVLAISEANLNRLGEARTHLDVATKDLWPGKTVGVVEGGGIWIDSLDDLIALRKEAEEAQGQPATRQPGS